MSQIAVGFKDATTGREKKTDGLWTHLGNMLLRTLTVTDKATLPAGTAQAQIGSYRGGLNWPVPANSVWSETPVQANFTTTGGLLRLEACGAVTGNTVGEMLYVGFGLNGAVILDSQTVGWIPVAGAVVPFGIIGYIQPGAGPHRVSVFLYNTAGAGGLFSNVFQTLYVTEQRA